MVGRVTGIHIGPLEHCGLHSERVLCYLDNDEGHCLDHSSSTSLTALRVEGSFWKSDPKALTMFRNFSFDKYRKQQRRTCCHI